MEQTCRLVGRVDEIIEAEWTKQRRIMRLQMVLQLQCYTGPPSITSVSMQFSHTAAYSRSINYLFL